MALVGWFFYSSKTGSRAIFLLGYNLVADDERRFNLVPEDESRLDKKAFCKYIGKQFLFSALLLCIGAILSFIIFGAGVDDDSIIAFGGIIVGYGGMLVLMGHCAYVRSKKMDMFHK